MHAYGNGSDRMGSVASQLATLGQLHSLVGSEQAQLHSKSPTRRVANVCGVSIQGEIVRTGSGGGG